ncbi:hypothetical protein K431DRAFT_279859 [Polychaeton citri CBS 116435]|uniref:Serine hydrolase domain-containing protein n=1 Tax=Polychaeton citri CBS 116435 TaxID=1314669 RepID=A0A9P4UJR8_9PEZI|nr:hypothetical protein K431DRAFT_279859 [Polychaeton citri CBS 116435]
MRFLCLHGRGTNSNILEAYLAPILSRVPGTHQYDYIDGTAPCKPWPGIEKLFPGPYFAYHFRHDVDACRLAIDTVKQVIEEDGPYDGVIAFSQGAALAISLLVDQAIAESEAPAPTPFKLAIFICSTLPLSPYASWGPDRFAEFEKYEASSDATYSLEKPLQYGTVRSITNSKPTKPIVACEQARFGHSPIRIPSLHIVGAKDPWKSASHQAYQLCDPAKAKLYVHSGGHEVPRQTSEVPICAQMMSTLFAKWQGSG